MKIERREPERRHERAIVLGLLAAWGIVSMGTLAYQQVQNRDPAENISAETERPEASFER